MARVLQPEDRIAHYRIIGPLGAGGMGEVYLANDETLGRNVALKVLPPELVRSDERVRRFVQEARTASSLNHPHIVTIYEVGQDVVHSQDGVSREPVHYIAMELVSGKTLTTVIHQDRTDLRTILGYLAQAAEGLAKAHAAGIVHRDLKPGNIMVTGDGYAKVLDFGLAKLTERDAAAGDVSSAPTEAAMTGGGVILGTVGYMAPEQIQAKGVDHRADVFAFGCILYEAAARRRPFVADSDIETMHKVLHEKPPAIDEAQPGVPAELRRLARRCLAKAPDQRLQSMKDLALELRELVDEYDTLSTSGSSGSRVLPALPARRGKALVAGIAAAAILGLAGIAFGTWALLGRGGAASDAPFAQTRMSVLLSDPSLRDMALSRDGRYLAYVKGGEGEWSLWVRQVSTGTDVQVLPPQAVPLRGIVFSPDGDHLYYLGRDPEVPTYSALFEIPSLGGSPRKRLFDVDTSLTFAPDGRRIAFLRGRLDPPATDLVIADLESGEERVLVGITAPDFLPTQVSPDWSPDGARIATFKITTVGGYRGRPVIYDVEGGAEQPLSPLKIPSLQSLAWLPDGSGLVAAGLGVGSLASQIYFIPYPGGERRLITRDVDDYAAVSVSADGTTLSALRTSEVTDLWSAGTADAEPPRRLTTTGRTEGIAQIRSTEAGLLLFGANRDDYRQLWAMRPDGSGRQALTSVQGWVMGPLPLAGGRRGVAFTQFADQGDAVLPHVWRADLDGGNPRRLTDGAGEELQEVSPDGETVLYIRTDRPRELWRLSRDGGEPERLLDDYLGLASYSPDGAHFVYRRFRAIEGLQRVEVVVVPAAGGDPLTAFAPPGAIGDAEWVPDGSAVTFVRTLEGVGSLWRHPLRGGEAEPITRWSDGIIGDHAWSPDGSSIAVVRVTGGTGNVWLLDADGGQAAPLTDFREGEVFEIAWAPDGGRLFLRQGEIRREAVLLRDTGSAGG